MKKSKGRFIFDIESNGLLYKADKLWCLVMKDIDTRQVFTYSDLSQQEGILPLDEGLEALSKAKVIVGHNIFMYDIVLLKLLRPDIDMSNVKAVDTLLLSQLLHFSRKLTTFFGLHGLAEWGTFFGVPKPKQEQWRVFEEAMIHRCQVDVEINFKTYHYLVAEIKSTGIDSDIIRREMLTAKISMKQVLNGWLFDKDKALEHVHSLDAKIKELADLIEPNLPPRVKSRAPKATWNTVNTKLGGYWKKVPSDRLDKKGKVVKLSREPTILKFAKSGKLHSHITKYFQLDPEDIEAAKFIWGPFTKVEFEKSKMSQHAQVKKYLLKCGWVPTEWTYEMLDGKKVRDASGKLIKKSPRLTEDSYASITGEIGQKVALHNTYKSRRNTLCNTENKYKGWVNQVREDGRLVCFPRTIGAATARMTHGGIVNVPGTKSLFGKEMREVFIAPDGKVIVACDMASAQLRLLAAAMGDPDYIKTVTTGSEEDADGNYIGTDIHSVNGIAAGLIDPSWVPGCKEWKDGRAKAKTFIYALLFGAGDAKIGTIVGGGSTEGGILRESFLSKLPSLEVLIDRLTAEWKRHKKGNEGWFEGLDGRRIYCSSAHKILNYKLQSDEAILLKEWMCIVDEEVTTQKLDSMLLLSYHDELNFESTPEEAAPLGGILKSSIQLAGKRLGLDCPMDGDYSVGHSWAEVH